ncbi:PEP-CTERM sorting domain-containing protein [Massilia sp. MS-15]|uniref:PEP-CTERM sorting domain-containing protein n=1 Tax=Massilia sp. MS-15 TaxID=2878200 RepID=UPI001CD778B0|nr:PEP-CTERM sorting domain-containing protein [Massilia sp. MS-15]MCA1246807.1 PEP-CTERM sorting domain-containing protein [Massilia sp. MS-15]
MLRLLIVIALAIAAVPTAQSAVITYNFTATVTSMFEYDGTSQQIHNVDASSMSGRQMAMGNTIHGKLTYDTNTALSPYFQPEQPAGGSYLVYGGAGMNELALIFDHDGYQFQSDPTFRNSHFQVANRPAGQGFDVFYMSLSRGWDPLTFESTTVSLMDRSGLAFSVGTMPRSLNLDAFHYASIDYAWLRRSDGSQVHASAAFTSLELASTTAVPEPSTILLIWLGLFAINADRKYRKSAYLAS